MGRYRARIMVSAIVEVELGLFTNDIDEAYETFEQMLKHGDIDLTDVIEPVLDGYSVERVE